MLRETDEVKIKGVIEGSERGFNFHSLLRIHVLTSTSIREEFSQLVYFRRARQLSMQRRVLFPNCRVAGRVNSRVNSSDVRTVYVKLRTYDESSEL